MPKKSKTQELLEAEVRYKYNGNIDLRKLGAREADKD
jgi:hypothetical protein